MPVFGNCSSDLLGNAFSLDLAGMIVHATDLFIPKFSLDCKTRIQADSTLIDLTMDHSVEMIDSRFNVLQQIHSRVHGGQCGKKIGLYYILIGFILGYK